ncbi:MAG TPA: amidohydrolase family protein [Anaerolineales bacterium]
MIIIDAHAYVGESLFECGQSPEELLRLMDRCGVDRAVLAPARPKGYALWPANLTVAEAVRRYPDRFFGMVRVDPWQGPAALEDLKRAYQDFGARGLLLHPWEEQFQVSSARVDPLVEYATGQGMFVMIEAGYPLVSHPLDIAELAHRHPQAALIATHGLQLDSSGFALTDAEVAMRECPNILMETSGMYAPETMENLVRDLGAERLMFGSHSPWLNLKLEVERARLLNLTAAQRDRVMGGNILQFLS